MHFKNVVPQKSQMFSFSKPKSENLYCMICIWCLAIKIVTVMEHCNWISHTLNQIIFGLFNILYYFPTEKMKSCCWEKLCICARNCQVYLMEKLSFHTHQNRFHFHTFTRFHFHYQHSSQAGWWHISIVTIYQTWYSHKTWLDIRLTDWQFSLSSQKLCPSHTLFLYHYY